MRYPTLLLTLLLVTQSSLLAAPNNKSGDKPISDSPAVYVSFKTDLVGDLPIAITALTSGEEIEVVIGPNQQESGGRVYATLRAGLVRNDEGSVTVTTRFRGESEMKQIKFDELSVDLRPGEEKVLFSSGDRQFRVGLPTPKE